MTPRDKAKQLAELQAELASIHKAISTLKELPTHTYCGDCLHADKQGFYCSQYETQVPTEYRNQSNCPQFEDDIPF